MKKALGRGLDALFSVEASESEIKELKINEIQPNKDQPRKDFDEGKLEELARSVSAHGIIQPIVVKREGNGYKIIAGERRWRAARKAGLRTIPAIVRDYGDSELMEIALIENLQREDLSPLEEAEAYKKLIEEYGLTQEEISRVIGKSRPAVANSLRLNKLHDEIKNYLREGKLTEGHARAILAIEDEKKQLAAARTVVDKKLSVRETELLVKNLGKSGKKPAPRSVGELEAAIENIEESLKQILGTKVKLQWGKKRGKIVIEYYSSDELERIINLMKKIG